MCEHIYYLGMYIGTHTYAYICRHAYIHTYKDMHVCKRVCMICNRQKDEFTTTLLSA